ncbi:thioesterase-like superfamily-domain-containing protein [Coniella lustricola]|uniref:Thioesterase-like superfamily-domain-containing protein n=1 Tax=Coniella lustricola TaxID=2025994 RepID=A0A2T3A5M6_9PEZI|nr:thioesterase-like superfamily-domain-containing protein [Coniella lustricola]
MPPRLRLASRLLASRDRSLTSTTSTRTIPTNPSPLTRSFSSQPNPPNACTEPITPDLPPPPSPRWLSDLQARIGKCIMFGCSPAQVVEAGQIVRALTTEWRTLIAGSEGFLTGGRRGLEGQQVVWGEMDSFQHVNNVTYIRYAESSRVNWATHFAVNADPAHAREWAELMTPKSTGLIMKSIKADFKFPMTYPDKISVYHKLRYPPSAAPSPSSLILDAVVISHRHRRVSARIEEDVVVYDYRAGKKTALLPFMHTVLDETFATQEREKARARRRIAELSGLVTGLEKNTWDRPDAEEDMGGGSPAPAAPAAPAGSSG